MLMAVGEYRMLHRRITSLGSRWAKWRRSRRVSKKRALRCSLADLTP